MINLLYSGFIILNKIFNAVIINESYNGTDYVITFGQLLFVCVIIGVIIKLFLPRAGVGE